MKRAFYYKRFKQLTYFDSSNTETSIYCEDYQKAKMIIKLSGVSQELFNK